MFLSGLDLKWYDGFFLSMLASSALVVVANWHNYLPCPDPLHVWVLVDYGAIFCLRWLMFADHALVTQLQGQGRLVGEGERTSVFNLRLFLLGTVAFIIYPFLWYWTATGALWFSNSSSCLREPGQKLAFLLWILFCFLALTALGLCIIAKWVERRAAYQERGEGRGGGPVREFQLVVEMLRDPWAGGGQSEGEVEGAILRASLPLGPEPGEFGGYSPALRLTPVQRDIIEGAIEQLPQYRMKVVNQGAACPICLEDFDTKTEVRPLPCAHIFHLQCINAWLRLNIRCPHCRMDVFPGLDITPHNRNSNRTRNRNRNRRNSEDGGTVSPETLADSLEGRTNEDNTIPLATRREPPPMPPAAPHPTPILSPYPTPTATPHPTPILSPQFTPRIVSPYQTRSPSPTRRTFGNVSGRNVGVREEEVRGVELLGGHSQLQALLQLASLEEESGPGVIETRSERFSRSERDLSEGGGEEGGAFRHVVIEMSRQHVGENSL